MLNDLLYWQLAGDEPTEVGQSAHADVSVWTQAAKRARVRQDIRSPESGAFDAEPFHNLVQARMIR